MTVDFPVTTHTELLPVPFLTPPVNPTGFGLYASTQWVEEVGIDQPSRHLFGVEVRGPNYADAASFGVWGASWCGRIVTVTLEDDVSGGTFTFTVDAQPATIDFDANAIEFRAALESLDSLVPGAVGVTSPAAGTWVLNFLRRHDVEVDGTSLTGGGVELADAMKSGDRPDILDPFDPITVWAYDECDLTAPSRAEVEQYAAQHLRLEEQVAVEHEFAARLMLDAADLPGTPQTAASFKAAVGYLEAQAALTNTLCYFHAGAQWASQEFGCVIKSGTRWTSPLGHTWILGGGYVDGLGDTIVATSQPFGWRDQPQLRTAIDQYRNIYSAVAERTVCIGYEAVIAAVEISS